MGPDTLSIIFVFSTPVLIVGLVSYFRYKTKQLTAGKPEKPGELEDLREERKRLEGRVQNLESIVCSVDLELNARLNRLAAQQSSIQPLALPAQRPAPPQPGAAGADLPLAHTLASRSDPEQIAQASPLPPGRKIAGRYAIEREIGHGGMGYVYLARDEKLGERVALKVISSTMATDPVAASERFRREVSSARKVTHPNVIRIHDLVEDEPFLLLSMEYVDGMTFETYLRRVGRLKIDEARAVMGQICDALEAAHAAGVIHRDLKPSNVLLDAEKRVKVIDFGLAKASFLQGMTATGLILGTPEYMAPEQVRGLPVDGRSDVYALGAIAYRALTGRAPFVGDTPIAIGFQHVTDRPPPLRSLQPDLSPEVEAAVLQALEKEPGKRQQGPAELKRALGG
jgi:serine/threonine-protein kinase